MIVLLARYLVFVLVKFLLLKDPTDRWESWGRRLFWSVGLELVAWFFKFLTLFCDFSILFYRKHSVDIMLASITLVLTL